MKEGREGESKGEREKGRKGGRKDWHETRVLVGKQIAGAEGEEGGRIGARNGSGGQIFRGKEKRLKEEEGEGQGGRGEWLVPEGDGGRHNDLEHTLSVECEASVFSSSH